ncbi:MAG: glycosyltransferase [Pseudomonadales bacterium]
MRYLFLTDDTYPPSRVDVSVLFGEEMTALGDEIDWVMQSEAPLRRTTRLPYARGHVWLGPSAEGNGALAKALRKLQRTLHVFRVFRLAARGNYDFIQVKDRFVGGVLALLAARLAGTKYVFWLAYPFPESWIYDAETGAARFPLASRVRGYVSKFLLYRIILKYADFAFVQSEQMKLDIAAEGVNADILEPVPMGVSESGLDDFNKGDRFDIGGPVVCYVGTMVRIRRLEFIVESFARVRERVPQARLVMVGGESDEDRERLRRVARSLGIEDSVVFTGWVAREEAWKWMRTADVCVSPFYPTPVLNSTSPTKLVEYLAQGTPVVANDHPEQTRVLRDSGGGLVAPWQPEAFASAILELLRSPCCARAMGLRGRDYVCSQRSYPLIARKVHEAHLRVVGEPH